MRSPTNKPLTIAVTGMNAKPDNPGPGLAVARCLRLAYGDDIRIIGLGYDVLDPGMYLDVCDMSYLLPYPSAGEQQLVERLAYIQVQELVDILIPCLDAELLSFSRLQGELKEIGLKMMIPNVEQLKARNKDNLDELCKTADIRYPETKNITSAEFFYSCHEQGWKYPMVVKGIFYDATVVNNAEEAADAFKKIVASWGYPVLVQRYVEGHEVNLTAVGDGKGNLVGSVMMRKQAVTDKGKAWACVTVHDETLETDAARLVKALQWNGPLEVEMLKEKDGQYLLIEINPRFPAWIYLTAAAGRNIPAMLVEMISGNKPVQAEVKTGSMMIRYAKETVIDLETFEAMAMVGSYQPKPEMQGEKYE